MLVSLSVSWVLLVIPSFPAAQTGPALSQNLIVHDWSSGSRLGYLVPGRAQGGELADPCRRAPLAFLTQLRINWTPASSSSSSCQLPSSAWGMGGSEPPVRSLTEEGKGKERG